MMMVVGIIYPLPQEASVQVFFFFHSSVLLCGKNDESVIKVCARYIDR